MAYVYRHIRLDKNQVFYIGIGEDDGGAYKRAHNKTRRSSLWKNATKNIEYTVEIVIDNISWKEAIEKEKEFIELYGRVCENSGTLVNITKGGDGGDTTKNKICVFKENVEKRINHDELNDYINLGWQKGFTEIHRNNYSKAKSGKKYSEEVNKKKGRPGHKHKSETIEKMKLSHIGIKKPKIKCPHCELLGAPSPMQRWHFNNCKNKSYE
jgi:hypothetical protein